MSTEQTRSLVSEQDGGADTLYADSTHRLFAIYDGVEEASEGTPFYRVEWDAVHQQRLEKVYLATMTPTGARRQLYRGKFYQAQFKVHEVDEAGALQAHFIWCYTDLQSPHEVPEIDIEAMEEQYGYSPLQPQNIAHSLAERAETPTDFSLLLSEMGGRGIEPDKWLKRTVNRVVYGLVEDELTVADGSKPWSDGEVYGLLGSLGGADELALKKVHTRMISKLLKHMEKPWGQYDDSGISENARGMAALALKTALDDGLIAENSYNWERLLTYPSVQRYDFGIRWIHATLSDRALHNTNVSIFRKHRSNYAHDFMFSVLDSRVTSIEGRDPELTRYIRGHLATVPRNWSQKETASLEKIFDMAAEVDRYKSGHEKSVWDNQAVRARHSNVSQAFKYVLDALEPADENNVNDERAVNQLATEIVDTVLYPLHLRALGRLTASHLLGSYLQEVIGNIRTAESRKALALAKQAKQDEKSTPGQ